jgi:hypothetical protein
MSSGGSVYFIEAGENARFNYKFQPEHFEEVTGEL